MAAAVVEACLSEVRLTTASTVRSDDLTAGGARVYVCICHAVTDDDVVSAIDDGARSVADISGRTRAGASCATCHDHLEDIVEARCGTCPLSAIRTMQVA
jgi:bacterioferritin-associated ferredoxin